jgi:hypothetical protein
VSGGGGLFIIGTCTEHLIPYIFAPGMVPVSVADPDPG